ncbi:MAG: BamA/TamA family outer membrane protein [Planctomycetaceae bacterium]|nr:BamA/TamA family outer membrane protein [Planctomycetaceae bacterium]
MTRLAYSLLLAGPVLWALTMAGCCAPCCCLCGSGGCFGGGSYGGAAAPVVPTSYNSPAAKSAPAAPQSDQGTVIRGQTPGYGVPTYGYPQPTYPQPTPGSDQYSRGPMPISGGVPATTTFQPPLPAPPGEAMPPGDAPLITPQTQPWWQPPSNIQPLPEELAGTPTPLDIFVEETRTGRFMFGVAVNSDAGVTGQITIDERNFDITRVPLSWDEFVNGSAFRGAGQGFRIEAQPGTQVQRYLVSFTNPYLFETNISFNASGFYYDRNYFDWTESRVGGRFAFGYRLTPDLSVSAALRLEQIEIFDPRVATVPELNAALGTSHLYSGRFSIMHDTRDLPFMPTEGHLIELSYEQAFGTFDYPRGEVDYSQYFLIRERPDGSGRHTLAFSTKLGFTGPDTPIFENYFAGGYSTLRGFAFRGASPIDDGVRIGGEFRWLNSLEYFFPITADDMIKGVFFCDFGTVEEKIELQGENFRVAPGFGFRVNVPALGPAPLAFDFAFPVLQADRDDEQMFSFFFGALR